MRYSSTQMNNTSAAACGGSCAARSDFFLILAGIALAVSVSFFAVEVLEVRLLGEIIIISLLAVVILVSDPPDLRKR